MSNSPADRYIIGDLDTTTPFRSSFEMKTARNSPRYKQDSAFRADFAVKLALTDPASVGLGCPNHSASDSSFQFTKERPDPSVRPDNPTGPARPNVRPFADCAELNAWRNDPKFHTDAGFRHAFHQRLALGAPTDNPAKPE